MFLIFSLLFVYNSILIASFSPSPIGYTFSCYILLSDHPLSSSTLSFLRIILSPDSGGIFKGKQQVNRNDYYYYYVPYLLNNYDQTAKFSI